MLTDYHLHLRPDELELTPAAEFFTSRGEVVGEPIEIGNGPGALAVGAGSVWVTAFDADAVVPIRP